MRSRYGSYPSKPHKTAREQVPSEELSEDWRDDDIWVFTVRRPPAKG